MKKPLLVASLSGVAVLLFFLTLVPKANPFWGAIQPGMTEQQVRKELGRANRIGTIGLTGAGGKPVTRWEYRRGGQAYMVDFDYDGPNQTPRVFRSNWETSTSRAPSWLPWPRVKARC